MKNPYPTYPNTLSHLTQEECDKVIDILFDFREGIAQVGDELVNDNTSTREMIDLNNEELRELDRLLDRVNPGAEGFKTLQSDDCSEAEEMRNHFHFGS
jgi:SMC interacting uncharacterized protein involved in chromosome segregation